MKINQNISEKLAELTKIRAKHDAVISVFQVQHVSCTPEIVKMHYEVLTYTWVNLVPLLILTVCPRS